MSRIDEMIKELCPEGVEMVKLSSLCTSICTGLNPRTNFKLNEDGAGLKYVTVKEIATNKIVFSDSTDKISNEAKAIINRRSRLEKGDILFSGIGTIGKVVYVDIETENWDCSESVFLLKPNEYVYGKYLSYTLISKDVVSQYESCAAGAIMKGVRKATLENLMIPLPPLSIQQEIVSVLDSFTTLIDKMKQEVEKRKKQMEYYREELLSPKADYEVKTLGELGTFTRGNGLQKTDFTEEGYPCIHYGQIHTYYGTSTSSTKSFCDEDFAQKLRKAKTGDLLIATTSEDVEACCKATVWLGEGEVAFSGDSYCYSHNQNPKYIAYLFQTEMFAKQKRMVAKGAKVVRVTGESMETFLFGFPSLDIQAEIVSTLDKFESYISKLEKMITLRQKQYEYYREKLLTFE